MTRCIRAMFQVSFARYFHEELGFKPELKWSRNLMNLIKHSSPTQTVILNFHENTPPINFNVTSRDYAVGNGYFKYATLYFHY